MRYSAGYILLAGMCTLVAACGLFKTRDPQMPTEQSTVNTPATSPEILLDNLKSAVEQKNVQEYEKVFSDSVNGARTFSFLPTQGAAVRYPAVFQHWTKDSEREYFRKAVAGSDAASTPLLLFVNQQPTVRYRSDSAVIETDYSLLFNHGDQTLTTLFKGHSFFFMAPDPASGTWYLYRWEDLETSKDSSWSEFKGHFGP